MHTLLFQISICNVQNIDIEHDLDSTCKFQSYSKVGLSEPRYFIVLLYIKQTEIIHASGVGPLYKVVLVT